MEAIILDRIRNKTSFLALPRRTIVAFVNSIAFFIKAIFIFLGDALGGGIGGTHLVGV